MSNGSDSIVNSPDQHGFVMNGLETIFLDHLAMFSMQDHMYQAILEVSLPPYAMSAYLADRSANPGEVYILGNSQFDLITMPQIQTGQIVAFVSDVFRGVPHDPNTETPLIHNVTVTIERVVYFRHFDYVDAFPPLLTYVLYGAGAEAHLSHRMTREPDFQQCADLAEPPAWLPPLQLESAVEINFADLAYSGKTPCSNPLTAPAHDVLYAGQPKRYPVRVATSCYFDTASLNQTDPC
jgi:hypothetical protein